MDAFYSLNISYILVSAIEFFLLINLIWYLQDEGGLNSTTDLIIRVLDVQDTAPFFSNQPYLGEISESAQIVSTKPMH